MAPSDAASFDPEDAVVVALGSNLPGEHATCEALLEAALAAFAAAGLIIRRRSRCWRSTAWPTQAEPEYRNAIALLTPTLPPRATLQTLLHLETALGRRRSTPNAPRTLDLDLIAHGRAIIDEPDLIVPHPRAAQRLFVMGPLAEIAPAWRHPVLHQTAASLARMAPIGRDAAPMVP